MRISIVHNILWSKYKGVVFSEFQHLARENDIDACIFQIASTDSQRNLLANVNLDYHKYVFSLLNDTAYESIPRPKLYYQLSRLVLCCKSDLVVLPGYHKFEYFIMLLLCKICNIKVAVFCDSTYYDNKFNPIKYLLKTLFFRNCDGYFGYGQRSRQYLLFCRARRDRIFIRCQAAALPFSHNAAGVLAGRLCHDGQIIRMLYVGRIAEEKNLNMLIEVFPLLISKFPSLIFSIVGDGPQKNNLAAKIEALNLSKSITFHGSLDGEALSAMYLCSSFLILPSTSEPWGLVVNEALSHGCPVVVSNACGCVPELVQEGVTGYSFCSGVPSSMVSAIVKICSLSNRVELSQNCLDVMDNFTPQIAAKQILDGCIKILSDL